MKKDIWLEQLGTKESAAIMAEAKRRVKQSLSQEQEAEEITVHLPAGVYRPQDFVFTEANCDDKVRITYEADGEVIVHGGLTLTREQWEKPDEAMAYRFAEEVREKIYMVDLTAYGFREKDWGEMQAIGAFETSGKYTDVKDGSCCGMFCGDKRMTIARYPNEGYNKLEAVADVGDVHEFPPQNYYPDWSERMDHRGGIYIIDSDTNKRLKGWADPSTAWMFGYFYWDWADSSTPITIDTEHRRVFPKYVSRFAAREGALYYFYNIPEELDTVGEWYLDRKNGKLYFYPEEGAASVDFYCSKEPLITCVNAKNLTFKGFTLQCTMGDAVSSCGDGIQFRNLTIKNIGGTGIVLEGSNNLVQTCDISHTGKGGVYMTGGDRRTLTPGNNRVTDCFIHEFSEVYQTYEPGVQMKGVGNRCDHNEIADSPHTAVLYRGNEQIVEYNYIHDMVLMSSDAGAIYAGFDWAANGCVVRYNRLERIGANGFEPHGIYWDDGHSGQSAYGNLMIGVVGDGFAIGGGRENVVTGNVLVDCGCPISYDQRNRDGFVSDGWARAAVNKPDAPHWQHLAAVPYDTEPVWLERYPRLSKIIKDFGKYDDPDFPINPAYSLVSGNIVINAESSLGKIWQSVYDYSTVDNNHVYASDGAAGFDRQTGLFGADSPVFEVLPEFENLPIAKMGRITKESS